MSSSNSLRQLVFSTRKCFFREGSKYWMLLPLNDCNTLKRPCMPLGTTDPGVRGEITSPARSTACIAKLSHIGSTPIPQFFCFLQLPFTEWLSNAFSIFTTVSGVYPEIFAWSGIVIFLYILYTIKKRKKLTYKP